MAEGSGEAADRRKKEGEEGDGDESAEKMDEVVGEGHSFEG